MKTGSLFYFLPKMTSTILFAFALCISLVLAIGENLEDVKLYEDQNIQEGSLLSKETLHAEETQKSGVRDSESDSQKYISNSLRKAIDQQHKLDLELATETTKLNELNKLKESEQINDAKLSGKLSKWQKQLLSNISKSKKTTEKLIIKSAATKTLIENLTASSTAPAKDETQIKDRTTKILKALENQNKIILELAIATKKLEELEKQKEAENVDATASNALTKWEKNLLNDITKAKEKKGDLTVEAAVIETKIDQLKQQLIAVGGSSGSIVFISGKNDKQINEKLQKAETNQWEIEMDLALATAKLEQLEKRKEDEGIDDQNKKTNLTKKQKNLLDEIEKAKEKKYGLSLKAALGKTLIEQLKHLLISSGKTFQ